MNVEEIIREKFKVVDGGRPPFACDGTRMELAALFAELGYTKGAEIGVLRAYYSISLCQIIPNLELICVDPWLPLRQPRSYRHQAAMDSMYNKVVEWMKPYGSKIMRMTSMEAAKLVPDNSLDFVYIDAAHDFDNVMADITAWEPKVRIGGIVSGHDYVNNRKITVAKAVDEYVSLHNIDSYYRTIADSPIDGHPSWFWVRK